MIVPRHWAEARAVHKDGRRKRVIRRFGWSDVSEADARTMAEVRVQEALVDLRAGRETKGRERKVPYSGTDGVPIREEILSTHGDVVVTRNSYGAHCLNTPDVLFADVDFTPKEAGCGPVLAGLVAGVAVAAYFRSTWITVVALVFGGPLGALLAFWARAFWTGLRGGDAVVAQRRIQAFSDTHPEWHLRVYRSPNGFRVLAMHDTFKPSDPVVKAFFEALDVDPAYRTMCERQQCFRARLTGKPWRMGLKRRMKPNPGTWPINPARMADRQAWVDEYERLAERHSACRFVARLGSEQTCPEAERVRELHDALSGADGEKPIA